MHGGWRGWSLGGEGGESQSGEGGERVLGVGTVYIYCIGEARGVMTLKCRKWCTLQTLQLLTFC